MSDPIATGKKQPLTRRQRAMVIRIDRLVYWLSRHWLAVFNTVAAIYVGLPILAPALMNVGLATPARAIYLAYSPVCHQMASRSLFLFGEQPAYPRAIAGTDLRPIEAYLDRLPEFAGVDPDNWLTFTAAARRFIGNEPMGYKMALCARDIGIYFFVLVGGLLFGLLRGRMNVRPLPLLAFIILGLGPIGLDGFSQLFSYWVSPIDGSAATGLAAFIQQLLPLRESTPFLRLLTGGLFGLGLVWLAYPHIDAGMQTTRQELAAKLSRAGVLK